MVTSPHEWKILEWDKQTNKQICLILSNIGSSFTDKGDCKLLYRLKEKGLTLKMYTLWHPQQCVREEPTTLDVGQKFLGNINFQFVKNLNHVGNLAGSLYLNFYHCLVQHHFLYHIVNCWQVYQRAVSLVDSSSRLGMPSSQILRMTHAESTSVLKGMTDPWTHLTVRLSVRNSTVRRDNRKFMNLENVVLNGVRVRDTIQNIIMLVSNKCMQR